MTETVERITEMSNNVIQLQKSASDMYTSLKPAIKMIKSHLFKTIKGAQKMLIKLLQNVCVVIMLVKPSLLNIH